jgi:hypothetical protein
MRDKFVPVCKSGVFRKFKDWISVIYWSRGLAFDSTSLIRFVVILSSTLKYVY